MFHVEHFKKIVHSAYRRLPKVNTPTFLKPAFFNTFAHSDKVAPLVKTSSTKMILASFLIDFIDLLFEIAKAFLIFFARASRSSVVCVGVLRVRLRIDFTLAFALGKVCVSIVAISSL